MIGSAKLAHRKSRWKLRRIIALLKSTREGTEGNSCCWKNWGHGHPAIRRLLHMKVIAYRKLPTVEFCISDSCENGITREKCLRNAQANHLFQSIPGSKAMLCNFQCVECLDKYVEQDDGRKGRIPRKDSKRMEGVFVVSDPSARQYIKVAGPTRKKAGLSSDRSENEKQKSPTRRRGSLA